MCGFAGFVGFNQIYPEKAGRARLLRQMGAAISRRGPDDEQAYDDDTLSFIFRRLSIVDLQTGQQPIWNENGNLCISINGEIYNHRELRSHLKQDHQFRTQSDSEVVLHLYEEMGPRCLDLLIGMFAIAIWDKSKKELFLARDRVGIKPLYYSQINGGFIFGSELKALLAFPQCPRELDLESLHLIPHHHGTVDGEKISTYIKDVHFLPGGSYALLNAKREFIERKYWDIKDHFSKSHGDLKSIDHYVDEYARLIEDSVDKRLMSDVPLGSFLSGGLDSALVTAIAARKNKDIHCFCALEQTTLLAGDAAAAEKLAKHIGVSLHSVLFDPQKILDQMNFSLEHFEYFIWMMDSPRFNLEFLFKHELHRYAKTKVPGLKVMLLGQGADEFAGGYSNVNGAGGNWEAFEKVGVKREAQWQFFESHKVPMSLRGVFSENWGLKSTSYVDIFNQMVLGRIKSLQAYNLWHEDRTSSVQGIESRVPFLDHRLIEFLVSIPPSLHQDLFWDKKIVRLAAERWIPKDLANRPKIPFYLTKNNDSIWDLKRRIIERIYPDFKEKYLDSPHCQFSKARLDKLFAQVQSRGQLSCDATDILLSCMSFACFQEICKASGSKYLSLLKPPSTLSEATVAKAKIIWNLKDQDAERVSFLPARKRWKDTDCLTLAENLKITFILPHTIRFDCGDAESQETELTPETEWLLKMFRLLSAQDYEPISLNQLAKKLSVPLAILKPTAKVLVKMKIFSIGEKSAVSRKAAS